MSHTKNHEISDHQLNTLNDGLLGIGRQDGQKVVISTPFSQYSGLPIGAIMPFAGSVAPAGCLFCDGSSLNSADYPDLYNVIGTTYGGGTRRRFFVA